MIKSKYNIGDKVLVREDLVPDRFYGIGIFVSDMAVFCNQIVTIAEVYRADNRVFYYKISNCDFWWSDEMFVENERKKNMPNIIDYTYNPEIALTTIDWADNTKTTVRAENPNTADQYTGFVAAVAKKACGNDNTINNLYDEWAIKRPEKEIKKQIIYNERLLEEKRIAEKRKTKREKWLIRKEALRLKREYEAKKLANEKYGVPMDEDK